MKNMRKLTLKKVISHILIASAAIGIIFSTNLSRVEAVSADAQDGMYGKIEDAEHSRSVAADDASIVTIRKSSPRSSNYTSRKGIDVSKWQGNINWQAVKNSGVEFAYIRVGYRGLDGELYEDEYFRQNMAGATAAGIRVGAYIYSEAVTEWEAIAEANFTIGRIYNYNVTMPIVIDYEYCGGSKADRCRLSHSGQDMNERTTVCAAFCNRVKQLGYTPCVYANKNTLNNIINGAWLANYYKIWVAQYFYDPALDDEYYHSYPWRATNYDGVYDFWQFSSQGTCVSGISSTYVDLDYWYDDGTIYGSDYSGVFDAAYYAEHNPDVVSAFGSDPSSLLMHFIKYGRTEGRQGSAEFNVYSYKNTYPDLREAFGNDLVSYYTHYTNSGRFEGRVATGNENKLIGATTTYKGVDYSTIYDYNYYVAHNLDVKNAFGFDDIGTLRHFVETGMKEGRQAKASFNVNAYKNTYGDLRCAFGSDLKSYYLHYLYNGVKEGRIATKNADKIVNPVTSYGGVDYSSVYDYNYYVTANPDVKKAFGNDDIGTLRHFVETGMKEGRQAKASFNVNAYKNTYSDLRQAYGNNIKSYYMHYVNWGQKEGRQATQNVDRIVNPTTVYNGVNYAAVYDFNYYIDNNRDVYRAFGNDENAVLRHFVENGMKEGRQAKDSFNVNKYKSRYGDLRSVYGDDTKAYYLHFINFGQNEGRIAQ